MAEPTVEEAPPETENDPEEEPTEDDDPPTDETPEVAEIDLEENDLGAADTGEDDLFTGEEGVSSTETQGTDTEDGDESDDDGDVDPLDALDARGESMEKAVNEGAARLAVVGLDEEEKEDLEEEFQEVFEAFRLGYFGSRAMEEYVFVSDDEEVDPIWGLLGSMVISVAFVVWQRPDGDEKVQNLRESVENMAGGL